jgi:acetyl-CoA acetyltransferase
MFSDIQGGFEKLNPDLFTKYELPHQGESAERIADKFGLTRLDLDTFAADSHRKASLAASQNFGKEFMVEIDGFSKDEGVRAQLDMKKMAELPTVFRKEGKVTAANASQISDGAAAVLITSDELAKKMGITPLLKFRARVVVAGDPTMQLLEIIPATKKALEKAKLKITDIDFLKSMKPLRVSYSRGQRP